MGLACLAVRSTLGVIVFPAGDALAGTVTGTRGEVTFSGGAGEANAVVFAFEGPDRIRISDSGVCPEPACRPFSLLGACSAMWTPPR